MEKILLAIDAIDPDMNALDFSCYLGRLTKSKVTGIFLENLISDERPVIKQLEGIKYVGWEADQDSKEHTDKMRLIEQNISLFENACTSREVCYRIHRASGLPSREMIGESRFADLIVMDPKMSFNRRYDDMPTEFVKDTLQKAECPIILAPESFDGIDEIVFAYNGSPSSVFAIKQFTYLLPQLHDKKVNIIQVNDTGKWEYDQSYKFTEWLNSHYNNLHFEALAGDADAMLFNYLFKKKNTMLVMGAYGRTALSEFFKHSAADFLVRTITQPIFVAHL